MKQDVMVVGIKALNDELMELELQPLAQVQEKPNLVEMAMGGNIKQMMKTIGQQQRLNHKIIVTREWCMKKQILPFCSMNIEIDTSDNHKKRTGTE